MNDSKQKKLTRRAIIAMLFLLLLVGSCTGLMMCEQNPDYHVDKAEEALAELEELLAAKEAGEEVDEALIEELIAQVVKETETAIEIADENSNPEELQAILEDINELQTDSTEIFNEALEVVESDEITDAIDDAITTTTEEQEQVVEAIDEVETAIEDEEDTVEVDIETTIDEDVPADGVPDGETIGAPDEAADGDADGVPDGETIGAPDTAADGVPDGETIGAPDTAADGIPDGTADGVNAPELPVTASEQAHENMESGPGNDGE